MKNTLFSEKSLSCTQIKTIREKVHCSQFEFASMLNVSVGTLRNWEQGRRKPDGAAIALLKLFSTNPEATAQSLSTYSVIDNFSDSEKKKIILSLNWDYEVDSDHILQVVKTENTNEKKQLFAKTFQYLHWQDVVRFWGMSVCLEMNNQTVRKMLIPSLRRKYDFIYGTILETNLSNAGFGASDSAKLFNSLLSHRRAYLRADIDSSLFDRTDCIENILTNKLSALIGRSEVKDVVDLLSISKNFKFSWSEAIKEAEQKESSMDTALIAGIICETTENAFNTIKWIKKPEFHVFRKELEIMAKDILCLGLNNLCKQ